MRKRVHLYGDKDAPYCTRIRKVLEAQEVEFTVRDLREKPLGYHEIAAILKHLDLKYFVRPDFDWKSVSQDTVGRPDREEVFRLIAEDNTLMIWPVMVSGRLLMVGDDLRRLRTMLLLKQEDLTPRLRADSAA
ncbi:MAG: hypothetical protein KKA42_14990 [candidate division Zixibacteria bacterium]|nr:hypothetical protein [candidate division Zixibacteria bacterium]